jgi:hypothetical protein
MFVNMSGGDYQLIQPNIINSESETSDCVDAWRFVLVPQSGSTSIDGSKDIGPWDMGYHYILQDFKYVIPKFKAGESQYADLQAEISIQNPNQYAVKANFSYYDDEGDLEDSGDIQIDSHGTYSQTLSDGDAPCESGSIEIKADGPLFGNCRVTENGLYAAISSYMTQIQHADCGFSSMSSVYLTTQNGSAH